MFHIAGIRKFGRAPSEGGRFFSGLRAVLKALGVMVKGVRKLLGK